MTQSNAGPDVESDSFSDSDTESLAGVTSVEAANAVWGGSRWVLFVGIALAAYVYSLDGKSNIGGRTGRRGAEPAGALEVGK